MADPLPRERGRRNREDLSAVQRKNIVSFFLERCSIVDGVPVPARGTTVAAANYFGVHRTTTAKIWKNRKEQEP